jgi:DNA-binding NarL/FixJ family response regulator
MGYHAGCSPGRATVRGAGWESVTRPLIDTEDGSGGTVDEIRVVLGQFDALIGIGLMCVLCQERGLRVIGHDLSDVALERAVGDEKPGVVVLDEPRLGEVSQLSRLKAAQPTVGIVVLVDAPIRTRDAATDATFLPKNASPATILAAIRLTVDNRRVPIRRAKSLARAREMHGVSALSPREQEVLEALRTGKPYKVLAPQLYVSLETFRTHASNIRLKLGVKNRWELLD